MQVVTRGRHQDARKRGTEMLTLTQTIALDELHIGYDVDWDTGRIVLGDASAGPWDGSFTARDIEEALAAAEGLDMPEAFQAFADALPRA
jgi:hypothetical protein